MTESVLEKAFRILKASMDKSGEQIADPLRFVADVLSLYCAEADLRGSLPQFSEETLSRIIAESLGHNEDEAVQTKEDEDAADMGGEGEHVHAGNGSLHMRERRGSVSGCANPFTASLAEFPKRKEVFDLLLGVLRETRLISRTMTHDQMAKLVATMRPEKIREGEQIITEGEYGNRMYIVEKGGFCIVKEGRLEAVLNERRLFGEISMLYSFPRTATVRCVKGAIVWVSTSDVYTAILMLDRHKIREAVNRLLEGQSAYSRLPMEMRSKIMIAATLIHYREGECVEKEEPGVFMAFEDSQVLCADEEDVLVKKGGFIPSGALCLSSTSVVFFPLWAHELFAAR